MINLSSFLPEELDSLASKTSVPVLGIPFHIWDNWPFEKSNINEPYNRK